MGDRVSMLEVLRTVCALFSSLWVNHYNEDALVSYAKSGACMQQAMQCACMHAVMLTKR